MSGDEDAELGPQDWGTVGLESLQRTVTCTSIHVCRILVSGAFDEVLVVLMMMPFHNCSFQVLPYSETGSRPDAPAASCISTLS